MRYYLFIPIKNLKLFFLISIIMFQIFDFEFCMILFENLIIKFKKYSANDISEITNNNLLFY